MPEIQRLNRLAQGGVWNGAMRRKAYEFGMSREQLSQPLTVGDIQNMVTREVQDVQQYPTGVGQRIGLTQDPNCARGLG